MKQGRDLVAMATELQRISAAKQDYVIDTRSLTAVGAPDGASMKPHIEMTDVGRFAIQPTAHGQMADRAGIPQKYYDRMLAEAPQLWASNLNHWWGQKPERRMIRTLDGNARAFLSDRYRRLDNEDVAQAALPILLESPEIQIISTEITERRLFIKAIFPRVESEVRVGDVVQAGVVISNSEIGLGSLSITPLIYRLVCLNGMTRGDEAWRKQHVGGMVSADDRGIALRDETVAAQDRALMLTMQDTIRAASGEAFLRTVQRMRDATEGAQITRPIAAIERLTRALPLTKGEGEGILERLIRDQDYTRYGVLNAITNLANTTQDYDRASELEAIGGRMLDLPANDWRQIAEAA